MAYQGSTDGDNWGFHSWHRVFHKHDDDRPKVWWLLREAEDVVWLVDQRDVGFHHEAGGLYISGVERVSSLFE